VQFYRFEFWLKNGKAKFHVILQHSCSEFTANYSFATKLEGISGKYFSFVLISDDYRVGNQQVFHKLSTLVLLRRSSCTVGGHLIHNMKAGHSIIQHHSSQQPGTTSSSLVKLTPIHILLVSVVNSHLCSIIVHICSTIFLKPEPETHSSDGSLRTAGCYTYIRSQKLGRSVCCHCNSNGVWVRSVERQEVAHQTLLASYSLRNTIATFRFLVIFLPIKMFCSWKFPTWEAFAQQCYSH
jgi:hypothetical protein